MLAAELQQFPSLVSKPAIPLVGVVVALLLAGCYGSTEPASEVGSTSVRLNAQGTANDGPAYSFFELVSFSDGTTSSPGPTTPRRDWPAGASGRFSEFVTGLKEATPYGYRVCGGDRDEAPACAQYRFFHTRGPDGKDSVKGTFGQEPAIRGEVDAVSGPSGESPGGSLRISSGRSISTRTFTGFVTCLRVSGNRATVGAVGQDTGLDGSSEDQTRLFSVVDDVDGANDLVAVTSAAGTTPPDCAAGPTPTMSPGPSLLRVSDN